MAHQAQQLSQADLLDRLDSSWGRYLPTLRMLPEEDQAAVARAQGFDTIKDLIAHLCATFQRTLDLVPKLASGSTPEDATHDEVALSADALQRYRAQPLDQVMEAFDSLWAAVGGMIRDLPDEAYRNPMVYDWLYYTVVTHYDEHTPPGDPQTPAEAYGGIRPATS
jgi:hypothetical protein